MLYIERSCVLLTFSLTFPFLLDRKIISTGRAGCLLAPTPLTFWGWYSWIKVLFPPIPSSAWRQGARWRGQEGSSLVGTAAGEDCSGRHSRWQYCALFPFVVQGCHMGAFGLLKGNVLSFSWMENGDRRECFTGLEGSLVGGQTPVTYTPWHHCPQGLYRRFLLWFETAGVPVWESKWGRGSVSAKTVFYKNGKRQVRRGIGVGHSYRLYFEIKCDTSFPAQPLVSNGLA